MRCRVAPCRCGMLPIHVANIIIIWNIVSILTIYFAKNFTVLSFKTHPHTMPAHRRGLPWHETNKKSAPPKKKHACRKKTTASYGRHAPTCPIPFATLSLLIPHSRSYFSAEPTFCSLPSHWIFQNKKTDTYSFDGWNRCLLWWIFALGIGVLELVENHIHQGCHVGHIHLSIEVDAPI